MSLPPIAKTIHVHVAPAAAFEAFTAGMAARWPFDDNATSPGATVASSSTGAWAAA